MNLAGIDLNLLVALDALLAERSVTRAARRVGLSQPAMSHALARLRALFDDPLLVRDARGMVPTARAEAIGPMLHEALTTLSRALAQGPTFDPATSRQSFRLGSSDYAEFVLFPSLLERIDRAAPGVELWVQPRADDGLAALLRGDLDMALGVLRANDLARGLDHEELFAERFVTVVRKGHRLARGRLTLDRYLSARHLFIAPGGTRGSVIDDLLSAQGRAREIALAVPHFLLAPHVVARTDLMLTIAERVALEFAAHLPLAILAPPMEIPGFRVSMVWNTRRASDPALAWLRGEVRAVADALRRKRETSRRP